MIKLTKQLAQNIVDKMMGVVPYNINIMDEKGTIIGSGDRSRIGHLHHGAVAAIKEERLIIIHKSQGGAKGIITAVLRILTAGVLAGVLIQSGAAAKIAETIVDKLGESNSLIALALATLVLTTVGVFIDVAVITVAPIALAIAKRANITRTGILIAMIGGGKAGNMMSPNPNAIAASDAFKQPLTSIMAVSCNYHIIFKTII
jgi:H+/gluconate symporter-like permease